MTPVDEGVHLASDHVEPAQAVCDFSADAVNHLGALGLLTQSVGAVERQHQASGPQTAQMVVALHQTGLHAQACRREGGCHARRTAAHHQHVAFEQNGHLSGRFFYAVLVQRGGLLLCLAPDRLVAQRERTCQQQAFLDEFTAFHVP